MAVSSRNRAELWTPKKYQERGASPERTKIWVEPKLKTADERKVDVVYYLSRDGRLEHPHFVQVPLSSPSGLHLRDVINRLNLLRGHGMANMYSWSTKMSYKNGFVWQDLSEDDLIHPSHGHEYILKGSQLPEKSLSFRAYEAVSSSTPRTSSEINGSVQDSSFPVAGKGGNQSWSSSFGDHLQEEYKVYKAKREAANAATQTGEERRRDGGVVTELSREEVSPPASYSSSGRLESFVGSADIRDLTAGNDRASGRIKASAALLMQLISCGSKGVDDCEPTESNFNKGM